MRIKFDEAENGNTKVKYKDLKNVLQSCTWHSLHVCFSHKGAQEHNRQQPFQQVSNFPTQTDCYVVAILYAMWVE